MNAWDRFLCDVMVIFGVAGVFLLGYGLLIGVDAALVPCAVSISSALGVNLLLRRRATPMDGHPVDTACGRQ